MDDDADWSPEAGDDGWIPTKPEAEHSDTELRFGPLYRRVSAIYDQRDITRSDKDILDDCRNLIRDSYTDDDVLHSDPLYCRAKAICDQRSTPDDET